VHYDVVELLIGAQVHVHHVELVIQLFLIDVLLIYLHVLVEQLVHILVLKIFLVQANQQEDLIVDS
jgi:hypothetical protein